MKCSLRSLLKWSLLLAFSPCLVGMVTAAPKKLLVVTVTTGFRHSSISTAEKVLAQLAKDSGKFTVDFVQQPPNEPPAPRKPALPKDPSPADTEKFKTEEASYAVKLKDYEARLADFRQAQADSLKKLSPKALKRYDAVVFANTTGDLPLPNRQALIDWIKSGKAFVGMHSASDTFHEFRPFVDMLGGEFLTHGAQATVDCQNQDPAHPACRHLGSVWTVHDEIYIMKSFERARVSGVLGLNQHPNDKKPGDYPVAWCRNFGKGRIFYTSLGHREDVWENPVYQKHILGGIEWALGLAKHKVDHAK